FRSLIQADTAEMRERGFDFSKDYRLLNELGQTLIERARQERGDARRQHRDALLTEARGLFERTLELDPENAPAHYNLHLVYRQLGDKDKAARHLKAFNVYRPDDQARDRAIAIARANNPAANHAAEAIVIYDLRREGAYELSAPPVIEGPAAVAVAASGG
ncbi:MAG TPA: tetratricopeptide repeat protein, partial [Thermoanaerobaculia bacterium]|nr:tetratricopeptide repeat protein [Thermoanaerobaculia bacterium]